MCEQLGDNAEVTIEMMASLCHDLAARGRGKEPIILLGGHKVTLNRIHNAAAGVMGNGIALL